MLVLLFLVALPLQAEAQDFSMNGLYKFYYAMNRIDNEVWKDNPNQSAAARHALMIMQDEGIDLRAGLNSFWDISVDSNPMVCSHYFGWYDEDGNYHEECSPWSTYQEACYTMAQIQNHQALADRVWWGSWAWTTAGIVASPINPWVAAMFGLMGQTWGAWYWGVDREVTRRRELQCP